MREPMSRLRRITHYVALAATALAVVAGTYMPRSGNHVHQAIVGVAFGLGACLIVWGIGLTIETEGARLRARFERRWSAESNGA
jgi:cytochrome c biogenesis protein CcdA